MCGVPGVSPGGGSNAFHICYSKKKFPFLHQPPAPLLSLDICDHQLGLHGITLRERTVFPSQKTRRRSRRLQQLLQLLDLLLLLLYLQLQSSHPSLQVIDLLPQRGDLLGRGLLP